MGKLSRFTIIGLCLAVLVQTVLLNRTTGARVWTRFPDPKLEQIKSFDAESMLFFDPAIDKPEDRPTPTDNSFALGWLPAGPGKYLLSVLTLGTLPVIVLGMMIPGLRRRQSHS